MFDELTGDYIAVSLEGELLTVTWAFQGAPGLSRKRRE